MNPRLLRQLETVDWDFHRRLEGVTSSLHWYPGSFSSSVPATLIQALTEDGDLVYDPFGGGGTTSAEALRLGRRALSVEVNPIGVLSNYVISSLILTRKHWPELFHTSIAEASQIIDRLPSNGVRQIPLLLNDSFVGKIDSFLDKAIRPKTHTIYERFLGKIEPQWVELAIWYHKDTLSDITELYGKIKAYDRSKFVALLVLLILSDRLRALSSQVRSWGHIADNVRPKSFTRKNMSTALRGQCSKIEKSINRIQFSGGRGLNRIQAWDLEHDWRLGSDINSIGRNKVKLLLTSPPYVNAIDYTKAHRLTLNLLGLTNDRISELTKSEIGARSRRFQKNSSEKWLEQILNSLKMQSNLVDENGLMALVLPHRDPQRDHFCECVKIFLEQNGWKNAFGAERSINSLRTRQSWTSITYEAITVYERANR